MTTPIESPYPGKVAWPVNWQASHLTGKFVDFLGDPVANKQIILTPSVSSFTSEATQTVITAIPRTVVTSSTGTVDIFIPATDDPDISPTGWTYKVEEKFGANRVYHIEALVGETLDLSRVVPTPPSVGEATTRGEPGPVGPAGPQGVGVPTGGAAGTVLAKAGAGDYDTIWLQVAEDGTIEGPSAYEVAVAQGFAGSVETWLNSLKGEQGPPGPAGFIGPQGERGIPGQNGTTGAQGERGISAYDHARSQGYTCDLASWLLSLRGPAGPGLPAGGTEGQVVIKTATGTAWSDYAGDGEGGLSAYEVAVTNGYIGTEVEWLASLRGPVGPVGATGPQGNPGPVGATGPAGPRGPEGLRGPQGIQGERGPTGISIASQPIPGAAYSSTTGRIYTGTDFPTDFPEGSIFFRKVTS